MNDQLQIEGTGNIGIQNVGENAEVNVTQILVKSFEYNDLLDKINTKQELFDLVPETDTERRLQLSADINQLKETFEQFKKDVTALAETFNKIEINTDRLHRAKEFFDQGAIGEARAVLETELEQMQNEQTHLLKQKEHYETSVLPNLRNNSEEFYLLAMATQADYENPNRFEDTCKYFKDSIKSHPTKDNTFQFANFLAKNNKMLDSKEIWNNCLIKFQNELDLKSKIEISNNIALADSHLGNFESADKKYSETVELAINLYLFELTETSLNNIAYIFNNWGLLLTNFNKNDDSEEKLKKALIIRQKLAQNETFETIFNLATTLLNIGFLNRNKKQFDKAVNNYVEALNLFNKIKSDNSEEISQNIGLIHNNLGDIYLRTHQFYLAKEQFEKALGIYFEIFDEIQLSIIPELVIIHTNLASIHQHHIVDKNKSIEYAINAIVLGLPLKDEMILIQEQLGLSKDILLNWNLTNKEISELITQMIKKNE